MGLTKNLENGGQVVVLYAKNFEWRGEMPAEVHMTLPVSGRVYRALKDSDSGAYYVSVDQEQQTPVQGIRLTGLCYSNTDFVVEMVELTDDNIIDFDITSEDFQKINSWVEDDHNTFINKLEGSSGGINVVVSKEDFNKDLPEIQSGDLKELGKKLMDAISHSTTNYQNVAFDAIDFIAERDPGLLEAITGSLVYISKVSEKEDKGPVISMAREISGSEDLGKGANIYTAISAIENYINTDPKVGGNRNSLNKAILHLLLELVRKNTNNKY